MAIERPTGHHCRPVVAALTLALAAMATGCGSDQPDSAVAPTTEAEASSSVPTTSVPVSTSTAAPTTTQAATTTAPTTSTTAAPTTTEPPTTTEAPTTSGPPPAPGEGAVFVVTDSIVLGWRDGASWVSPDPNGVIVPSIGGQVLRSAAGGAPVTVGADPVAGCFPEEGRATWLLDGVDGLHVSGGHPLQPRPVEDIQAAPAHAEAVRAVLVADGVDAPVEIDRVVRFDLEGDGSNEVLVEANRIADESLIGLGPGNYSVVLFRRVGPTGDVEDVVVHADTRPPPAGEADSLTVVEIEGLADVDGDGILELGTSYRGYEWSGAELIDLQNEPAVLLTAGCGV